MTQVQIPLLKFTFDGTWDDSVYIEGFFLEIFRDFII